MGSPVAGQVVAVTGGTRGIGRAIAAELASAGAKVAIGGRDAEGSAAVAAELAGTVTGTVVGHALDVADTASFKAFLAATEAQLGPIDVLVNNAGVMWVGAFDEEPESATTRMLAVNVHGVIHGVRLVAPGMRSRGRGHIITIASAASLLAPPGEATYAATKHAVRGYLTGVREELRGSGVHVSVLMPGVVDTEMAVGTSSGAAKLLRPEDVARVVRKTLRRPKFEVTIPGYIGPLHRVVSLLPERPRAAVLRRLVPDQVAATSHSSARDGYESQALRD